MRLSEVAWHDLIVLNGILQRNVSQRAALGMDRGRALPGAFSVIPNFFCF